MFGSETERSIFMGGTGIGIYDLILDADETGTLSPILEVLDDFALVAGNFLPRKLPSVVRIASE